MDSRTGSSTTVWVLPPCGFYHRVVQKWSTVSVTVCFVVCGDFETRFVKFTASHALVPALLKNKRQTKLDKPWVDTRLSRLMTRHRHEFSGAALWHQRKFRLSSCDDQKSWGESESLQSRLNSSIFILDNLETSKKVRILRISETLSCSLVTLKQRKYQNYKYNTTAF